MAAEGVVVTAADRANDILDAIDGALHDYELSDDAMRWSPPEDGTTPSGGVPWSWPHIPVFDRPATFRVLDVDGQTYLVNDAVDSAADAFRDWRSDLFERQELEARREIRRQAVPPDNVVTIAGYCWCGERFTEVRQEDDRAYRECVDDLIWSSRDLLRERHSIAEPCGHRARVTRVELVDSVGLLYTLEPEHQRAAHFHPREDEPAPPARAGSRPSPYRDERPATRARTVREDGGDDDA